MPETNMDIPGYDILEQIGKGGMACVYRARQHTFDRDVALKVLHSNLSDDGNFSQRFLMESMTIAKLHHSHIVHVYDVGEVHGNHYIAMEYLSGSSLHDRLSDGIAIQEMVTIVQQMASALDYAHQKGIIHRDIKPDNIMFRDDGAAVLTDFGIAKDIDTDITLTQVGTVIGTPKYMSPEQIRGADVRAASDIYSLGVVFYQMLTGSVPYDGGDMVATAFMHINDPIPTLPPSLDRFQAIINKMLAKQCADRYSRGNDVVAALKSGERGPASAATMEGTVDMAAQDDSQEGGLHDSTTLNLGGSQSLETPIPASVQAGADELKKRKLFPWLWGSAAVLLVSLALFLTLANKEAVLIDDKAVSSSILIDRLLVEAERNVESLNLMKPANDNAFDKYQQVLKLESGHPEALKGIDNIAKQYFQLATNAYSTSKWQQAVEYLDQAEGLDSGLKGGKELRENIRVAKIKVDAKTVTRKKTIVSLGVELQIEGLMQGASRDEREGRITKPKGNNAAEKYQRILALNPDHLEAKKKLSKIE